MSKRPFDTLQPKITRNDRFAQMSHQEKIIEQKKKEIQAKLEAKQKATADAKDKEKSDDTKQANSPGTNSDDSKTGGFNTFSNDGSFLNQFKQLKEKKLESKHKSFNKHSNNYNDDRNKSKWAPKRRSPSPHNRSRRQSRFSAEKVPNFEQKITINTTFSISTPQSVPPPAQPTPPTPPQQQQPSFENIQPVQQAPLPPQPTMIPPQQFPNQNIVTVPSYSAANLNQPAPNLCEPQQPPPVAPPAVLLNVPPPQIVNNSLVLSQPQNVLVSAPLQQVSAVLTTVTLPPPIQNTVTVPPPCLPTVELASIPPPNPIQVQNIPQPEPINTMNIPPPAPIQVHTIPTPHSIQLNEIPNPKPLDLLAIPTPNEDKGISDPDFIKNVPPPNKSVPPPNISGQDVQLPPNVSLMPPQNLLLQNNLSQPTFLSAGLVATPQGQIPSLMATPILPPPGMGVPGVNVNCPPPILTGNAPNPMLTQQPPPFVSQPPPVGGQMPPMNVPPPVGLPPMVGGGMVPGVAGFKDMNAGTAAFEAMSSLARMVADCGPRIEDVVRQKKTQDPALWFLFHKDSAAFRQYAALVEQYERERDAEAAAAANDHKPELEDVYEPEMALDEDCGPTLTAVKTEDEKPDINALNEKRRKRKSRWGEKDHSVPPPSVILANDPQPSNQPLPMLSKVTRSDPGLVQYAINAYGSSNLSEEDWKKAEDNYKVHLLYQDMMRKREEVQRLQMQGKNKYEYDSDEDTDGGTWEHKLREKEMTATQLWAQELTRQAEGKHHIGDFLPPDELKRFLEKSSAVKEGRLPNFSDYKEFKIKEDNIGFQMLQKLGWTEGEGLGSQGTGIVEPVNKGAPREHTQGLGLNLSEMDEGEDEYESYRKRMMLAYRFRPNPLNNPRRPYY